MVFLGGMDPQGEMESKNQPDPLDPQVLTVGGGGGGGGGGHLHQVGEEFLPTSGRHRVSLLWHHWRHIYIPRRRWSQLPVYASGPTIQPHTHIQK